MVVHISCVSKVIIEHNFSISDCDKKYQFTTVYVFHEQIGIYKNSQDITIFLKCNFSGLLGWSTIGWIMCRIFLPSKFQGTPRRIKDIKIVVICKRLNYIIVIKHSSKLTCKSLKLMIFLFQMTCTL
jgi:hypothetical protein